MGERVDIVLVAGYGETRRGIAASIAGAGHSPLVLTRITRGTE